MDQQIGTKVHRIEYACGHIDDVPLFGTSREQIAEVLRLEARSCLECYRENRARQTEAFTRRVEAERPSLSVLVGTPRQVQWGQVVRAYAITLIEEVIGDEVDHLAESARAAQLPGRAAEYQDTAERLLIAATEIGNNPDSAFWIENRAIFASTESTRTYLYGRVRGHRLMF